MKNTYFYFLIFDKTIKLVSEKYGWETEVVKVNHIDLAVQTYYPVVYVESFSGTRKFDGRKYGKKIEEGVRGHALLYALGQELKQETRQGQGQGQKYGRAILARPVCLGQPLCYQQRDYPCLFLAPASDDGLHSLEFAGKSQPPTKADFADA